MVSKENAKQLIKGLFEKYQKVVEEKRVSKYNEEMTKKDFILPLFRALGWDVENSLEVTAEETISKKRVDYGFRINGIPKFFLEAKALKEDLSNPKFIGQAIDYAWWRGCTWAVLSDFEGVMIFNAEWKTGDLLQNLFLEIPCADFLDRFEELWLLSRESFEQGLIDKEAEKRCKKAKLAPIDQYLLDDFARWRNALSKNILKYNPDKKLSEEELDETVQKLLNRLVFIRKAEDAELEERVLESALRGWESDGGKAIYVRLGEIFKKFRDIYDSELFEEALVDQVVITNDVLKEVITGLYKPAYKLRRYDFSKIDADVLGNVYEQYLGHILKKTKKRADVKESHARRKEQGIYYTPTYIVDYIVRNTLGELLKDKKMNVEKIRVLDPASGSGSFLIKAFDILNEHYSKHDKDYSQTQLDTTGQGTTFTKKVEILQKNIFGVDLDKQAVEIARLNLLLKITEKGQRLPLLRENIKNGNSLIDDEKVAEDKAFEWEKEFKQIMGEGGFNVVIGNPPYIRTHELSLKDKSFYSKKFVSAIKQYDIYVLFYEKGLNLLKDEGKLGFIASNKFTISDYGEALRKLILNKCAIEQVIDVSNFQVFKDASTYPFIFILRKEPNKAKRENNQIKFIKIKNELELTDRLSFSLISQKSLLKLKKNLFIFSIDTETEKVIEKINKGEKIISIFRAKPTTKNIIHDDIGNSWPVLTNRDVNAYSYTWDKKSFIKKNENFSIKKPCIFVKKICYKLTTTLVEDPNLCAVNTIYVVTSKDKEVDLRYLLAILNSKLVDYYTKKLYFSTHMRGGYIELRTFEIESIPIKIISKSQQQPIVNLADKMLLLNKRLNEIGNKKTDERQRIEEEIKRTDAEIDELVYKIYGLDAKDRAVIEEFLKKF